MINPSEAVKSIQDDQSFLDELKMDTVEMVLRELRQRVMNMSKEQFDDWILNVEAVEFFK